MKVIYFRFARKTENAPSVLYWTSAQPTQINSPRNTHTYGLFDVKNKIADKIENQVAYASSNNFSVNPLHKLSS